MDGEHRIDVTVTGEVDASSIELRADMPLRVAAVHAGTVLGSQTLDVESRARGRLRYSFPFPLPFPCGFDILLGRADVPDRVFLTSELARLRIAPHELARGNDEALKAMRSGAPPTESFRQVSVEAPVLTLDAATYARWLLNCRHYRVRGRVVCRHWRFDGRFFRFCDDPVPGATVEVYDVDCFWWFCKKDLITTATTNPDGTFEAEFWWCCTPRRPWFDDVYVLDPDLFERFKGVLERTRPRLPIPLPDPPPDPRGLEPFLRTLSGAVLVADAGAPSPIAPAPLSDVELVQRLSGADLFEGLHVWPWDPRRDCAPDVLLRVTQPCAGVVQVIYEESFAQTRWDVPGDLDVTLMANAKACCIPRCEDPDCDDCFKFGQVGSTLAQNIGGNDPLVPVATDLLGLAGPGSLDYAFARTLNIYGTIGSLADLDWYEIEHSSDGTTWAPLPSNTLGGFYRTFWGMPCGGGLPQFNSAMFAPTAKLDGASAVHNVYETRAHYQANCPGAPWEDPSAFLSRWWTDTNRDLALVWITASVAPPPPALTSVTTFVETPLMADGLYWLRVVGWKEDAGGTLVDRQVMRRCNTLHEERLVMRLDNRTVIDHAASVPSHPWGPGYVHIGSSDPDCDFVQIIRNQGADGELTVNACDVVKLSDTDTLTIRYVVTVPAGDDDRHLGGYWMTAHHGESAVFDAIAAAGGPQADPTPHPGPTYALAVGQGEMRRWWGGGSYKVVLPGSAFPETCAYLFRLHAYKRVFDGSQSVEWFHQNDCEISLTIEKV